MSITLKAIEKAELHLTIRGVSPMIQHAWSEKALTMMREKHAGKKTRERSARNPQAEGAAAAYMTEDGRYGVPAMAFKSSLITAAHKDIGIEKTLLRKALFIKCDDAGGILPMECDEPIIREDCVRVGAGSADLRYRPEYRRWSLDVSMVYDAELLRPEDIVNLVNRAGFGCGMGEWRPEKGGEYGRFEVDAEAGVKDIREAA